MSETLAVEDLRRIAALCSLEHVGGESIAIRERRHADWVKAFVPVGELRLECRLGLDRDHCRSGAGDRECRRRVTTAALAVEYHVVEFFEEAVINQSWTNTIF